VGLLTLHAVAGLKQHPFTFFGNGLDIRRFNPITPLARGNLVGLFAGRLAGFAVNAGKRIDHHGQFLFHQAASF
jgi:hypothetical protein